MRNQLTCTKTPVQAGFVTKEEDWKYSSARDFCGMKGLVELSYSQQLWHKKAKLKAAPHSCANTRVVAQVGRARAKPHTYTPIRGYYSM